MRTEAAVKKLGFIVNDVGNNVDMIPPFSLAGLRNIGMAKAPFTTPQQLHVTNDLQHRKTYRNFSAPLSGKYRPTCIVFRSGSRQQVSDAGPKNNSRQGPI